MERPPTRAFFPVGHQGSAVNDDASAEDAGGAGIGVESRDEDPDGDGADAGDEGFWGGDAVAVDAGDPAAENVAFVLVGALLTLFALGRVAGLV